MHSKIFQIATEPIKKEDYAGPSCYYESSEFADYIGDEVTDEQDRKECIKYLAKDLNGVFEPAGESSLVYLGKDALHKFLGEWADKIKAMADELTAENILSEQRLYKLKRITMETHRNSDFRVDIGEWNGWAGPMNDLIEFASCLLKAGDKIYIGAIIDYHC